MQAEAKIFINYNGKLYIFSYTSCLGQLEKYDKTFYQYLHRVIKKMKNYENKLWQKRKPRRLSPTTGATFPQDLLVPEERGKQDLPKTDMCKGTEKQTLCSVEK